MRYMNNNLIFFSCLTLALLVMTPAWYRNNIIYIDSYIIASIVINIIIFFLKRDDFVKRIVLWVLPVLLAAVVVFSAQYDEHNEFLLFRIFYLLPKKIDYIVPTNALDSLYKFLSEYSSFFVILILTCLAIQLTFSLYLVTRLLVNYIKKAA